MTIVCHTYRTSCATVRQPPGFGDFLRGALTLAILSLEKGFTLRIDFSHHPIGQFIGNDKTPEPTDAEVHEFFNERGPLLRPFLDALGPSAFVSVTTNIRPDMARLSDEARTLVLGQCVLEASVVSEAEKLAETVSPGDYAVFHVRVEDHKTAIPERVVRSLVRIINERVQPKWGNHVAVISNSVSLKRRLSEACGLPFIGTKAVHLGECSGQNVGVRDTLIDFRLLSRSSEIFSWSVYGWQSGFSYWCACLHNIPFLPVDITPGIGSRLTSFLRCQLGMLAVATGMRRRR